MVNLYFLSFEWPIAFKLLPTILFYFFKNSLLKPAIFQKKWRMPMKLKTCLKSWLRKNHISVSGRDPCRNFLTALFTVITSQNLHYDFASRLVAFVIYLMLQTCIPDAIAVIFWHDWLTVPAIDWIWHTGPMTVCQVISDNFLKNILNDRNLEIGDH